MSEGLNCIICEEGKISCILKPSNVWTAELCFSFPLSLAEIFWLTSLFFVPSVGLQKIIQLMISEDLDVHTNAEMMVANLAAEGTLLPVVSNRNYLEIT